MTTYESGVESFGKTRVVTENIRPPIPTKAFDWIAYRDGNEEGYRGFGSTEAEAIAELLESEQ